MSLSVLGLSTGWWVGLSSPGNEPEEGPEGSVGAPALDGQVKTNLLLFLFTSPSKPLRCPFPLSVSSQMPPGPRSLCSSLPLESQGGLWVWRLWPSDQALRLGFYKVCRSPASSRWTFSEMLSFHLDSWSMKAKGGRLGSCVAFLGRAR